MRLTEPEVFLLSEPQLNREGARDWLDHLGADKFELRELVSDAAQLIELAGRQCYMSFNVELNPNLTMVRNDIVKYMDNLLASRHGSVLEHASFTFAINNVSRVYTGEMNRHRAGMAISERSMRFIRYTDIPFWMPFSMRENDEDNETLAEAKETSRFIFEHVFLEVEKNYTRLVQIWGLDDPERMKELFGEEGGASFKNKKHITSALRRIIPMGVSTGGVWTGNIRALRHIFEMRCSAAAEEEILFVAGKMLEIMMEKVPTLFKDFEKNEEGFWTPEFSKV